MRAGKLRHQVIIQRLVAGSPQQKPSGEPDTSWTTYLTVSASVEPVTGREPFLAQEHLSEVDTKIRIRYRDGITADMRVSFGSRYYNIRAILNFEERNRELLLLCSQGLNQG